MLHYPQIDPVAFQIGPIAVHWYGLMYLIGFSLVWMFGRWRIRRGLSDLTLRDLEDLIFYSVLGVVAGGRLGYVLFYKPSEYLSDPIQVLYLWQGGMSFHGGLIGVIVVLLLFARQRGRSMLEVGDFIAPLIPLGLAAGRLGNFINGELWGRPTQAPWGMVFPQAGDSIARHPSQLYEMALEGFVLFAVLWWFARKPRPTGQVSALFLIGYGAFRFMVEYTREPDYYLGLLAGGLSMGQLLSLPMILAGALIFVLSARRSRPAP
ncbi:prolipoprotein diacylglyceryl transferase [Parapusillimonas granuli]|uniref:Phosphatidylglycerol--prolipoprotein diacylglyceryl transferase n=1 Tax=Parapusillimonas granuli TaxID=380911 RepID=A0A853G303_9BURK|nr:prolipoprotein diacylglyceryl transferase [Parapusillimonas granuli]MBB5216079.1 phosphatidylglycerol:prolipoprotein diacylglycerol transferase [Parapusillimonas granuli]MEB2401351.1 prolipoprotein diacylglyceryl transferase [Alcaligenaceae bacterium]NYT50627.1 prolipoprotein diacylglyceryl transferase [Parapusillimonas granuli]